MHYFLRHPDSDKNTANFLKDQDLFLQSWEAAIPNRPEKIKFSIVVPVYRSNLALLRILVDSIINQTYKNWELLLIDDGSSELSLTKFLKTLEASDGRIIALALESNQGISAATNLGLANATGDFICLADHDDVIHSSSLSIFADQLYKNPDAAWIYSDEAKISADSKRIYDLFFKPDWSPYYLMTCMYTAHFAAYRTDLIKNLKFRSTYDGAQDYDFALRLSRQIEALKLSVLHVPFIFYFWRAIPGSTALSMDEKPASSNTGLRVLNEFAKELDHIESFESTGFSGSYSAILLKYPDPISIIIPSALKSVEARLLLQNCISSIEASKPIVESEIVVVLSKGAKIPELNTSLKILWVHDIESDVNIARKMNIGAAKASYPILCFMNDDILVTKEDSLQTLAGFLQDIRIGTIAPKLLYPNENVQCAGVAFNEDGLPDHIARNANFQDPGYFFALVGQREVEANTGALMLVTRATFNQVGGFKDELPINYNDIDFCLRLGASGFTNLIVNHISAIHLESASRDAIVASSEEQNFLNMHNYSENTYYSKHLNSSPMNYELRGFNSRYITNYLR
jgi:glycosyltransferase involved in cell wall biosynthesis